MTQNPKHIMGGVLNYLLLAIFSTMSSGFAFGLAFGMTNGFSEANATFAFVLLILGLVGFPISLFELKDKLDGFSS